MEFNGLPGGRFICVEVGQLLKSVNDRHEVMDEERMPRERERNSHGKRDGETRQGSEMMVEKRREKENH